MSAILTPLVSRNFKRPPGEIRKDLELPPEAMLEMPRSTRPGRNGGQQAAEAICGFLA
ncbi:MAG: hypothetical protein P8013_03650 [Candidatus Sulfobium sp.]